jgi:4-hydroxybenzoate polyprenyltransferase
MKVFPYLVLARPANVVTALADIIAGIAIAGLLSDLRIGPHLPEMLLLMLSSAGLYAGGIVFNDFFDLETDRVERPERILPSGQISKQNALVFGATLLLLAILFAFMVGLQSGLIAIAITVSALLYDKIGKHHAFWGPLNMGLCRGLNLTLGMSILPLASLSGLWLIGLLPIVFIAAVTLTSRGEITAGNVPSIILAVVLDLIVASAILILGFSGFLSLKGVLPFLTFWLALNLFAKIRAIRKNEPEMVMKAVKIGVISLIPLDASYVAGFGHWIFALAVLLLLPIALLLSRKFAVT